MRVRPSRVSYSYGLELRRGDVGSHEILQRMLEEVQGLGVQPIELIVTNCRRGFASLYG